MLRRLQVDLRPRAGEVRPGLVAGAPDLPGQLRRPTVPDVLAWYKLQPGDNGEYVGSQEEKDWTAWHDHSAHAAQDAPAPAPVAGN